MVWMALYRAALILFTLSILITQSSILYSRMQALCRGLGDLTGIILHLVLLIVTWYYTGMNSVVGLHRVTVPIVLVTLFYPQAKHVPRAIFFQPRAIRVLHTLFWLLLKILCRSTLPSTILIECLRIPDYLVELAYLFPQERQINQI